MALTLAVIWGVLSELVQLMLEPNLIGPDDLIIRGVGALIVGFVVAAIRRRRLRQSGGLALTLDIHAAIKAGRLPPEATAEEWLPVLRYSLGQSGLSLWLVPILFGVFAVLGIYVSVTADSPRSVALGVVCTVTFLAVALWTAVTTRRRLPIILRFIAELDATPPV